ncbi:hypothetical protein ACFVYA_40895 [Amycolatopsis sp. NPDC058278]|uniref:hypothetical protein n=1 Tax=Amycolatopsis sp. NPDC058278 TaxID=3346417 RepID=UPI0036DD2AAA
MKVGGRDFGQSKRDVEEAMRGEEPEQIRKHLVEVNGTVYPPKQVLAHVTGWDRQTFTTMEAQRVLTKLGFVCREAGARPDGSLAWGHATGEQHKGALGDVDRIAALEAALATAQAAIAGLDARVRSLEDRR